ncbi:uncharacterized protein LOC125524185 isoform X2 [Triticum urartu]|uniref:uncharacterized protein LOC125524185 isoform X2 n=1 Tax=Triticum urartu TaxID=4572 RepID=UPI0020436224|nr:uncharacterized protein LOC125524185 isoform X2 [Triticum urartu]
MTQMQKKVMTPIESLASPLNNSLDYHHPEQLPDSPQATHKFATNSEGYLCFILHRFEVLELCTYKSATSACCRVIRWYLDHSTRDTPCCHARSPDSEQQFTAASTCKHAHASICTLFSDSLSYGGA